MPPGHPIEQLQQIGVPVVTLLTMDSYKSMIFCREDKIAGREFIDTVVCYFLKIYLSSNSNLCLPDTNRALLLTEFRNHILQAGQNSVSLLRLAPWDSTSLIG